MHSRRAVGRLAVTVLAGAVALTGCSVGGSEGGSTGPSDDGSGASGAESVASDGGGHEGADPGEHDGAGTGGHDGAEHPSDGGPAPEGIAPAEDPEHPVGTEVTLTADHMEGMAGATATISGAFDTTAYSISYTPTDGGDPVTDHRWVVHEELEDPGEAPVADGSAVVVSADHMAGMAGAEATIDRSTQETVYMVDYAADGMEMTRHKWVVASEVEPAG